MTTRPSATSSLRTASFVFIASWVVHAADHIRRTSEFTSDGVLWAGTLAAVTAAVAITLILVDHPVAPFAAVAAFGSVAVGTAAAHLAPGWGYFSEPLLFDSATDRLALLAAVPEIGAALWLTWLGFRKVQALNFQVPVTAA